MKALTQSVLAAAMLLALPFAAAEACTTGAWNGTNSAAAGVAAAGPASASPQRRYSGACSAQATSGEFVTDNTPGGIGAGGEATYRARFYVFTSGNGKFFSATTGDNAGGTEVVGISFNGSAFTFAGPTGIDPIPAAAGKWYSVEFKHESGQPFTVAVQGNGAATAVTDTGVSASASVGSASLGFIGSGSGSFIVDEFESTRSATAAIGRLCPGDTAIGATPPDGIRDAVDGVRMRNEGLGVPTGGQPDLNEDGVVDSVDGLLARNLFLSGNGACPASP